LFASTNVSLVDIVGSNILDYICKIKFMVKAEKLGVPVIERVCLGKCGQGPVMRIAPAGKFFTEITNVILPGIIDEIKT
jgi:(2Fe-2S) ferredoxin